MYVETFLPLYVTPKLQFVVLLIRFPVATKGNESDLIEDIEKTYPNEANSLCGYLKKISFFMKLSRIGP